MPDHNTNKSLFAECLQAEATYGTPLPCDQFAEHRSERADAPAPHANLNPRSEGTR